VVDEPRPLPLSGEGDSAAVAAGTKGKAIDLRSLTVFNSIKGFMMGSLIGGLVGAHGFACVSGLLATQAAVVAKDCPRATSNCLSKL